MGLGNLSQVFNQLCHPREGHQAAIAEMTNVYMHHLKGGDPNVQLDAQRVFTFVKQNHQSIGAMCQTYMNNNGMGTGQPYFSGTPMSGGGNVSSHPIPMHSTPGPQNIPQNAPTNSMFEMPGEKKAPAPVVQEQPKGDIVFDIEDLTVDNQNAIHRHMIPGMEAGKTFCGRDVDGEFYRFAMFSTKRPYVNPFDVLRTTIAPWYKITTAGKWAISVTYRHVDTIPLPTKKMLEIRAFLERELGEDMDKWALQDVLDCLETLSKSEWSILTSHMTKLANIALARYAVVTDAINAVTKVTSVSDLIGIEAGDAEVYKSPKFTGLLSAIIVPFVYHRTFGQNRPDNTILKPTSDYGSILLSTPGLEIASGASRGENKVTLALAASGNVDALVDIYKLITEHQTAVMSPGTVLVTNLVGPADIDRRISMPRRAFPSTNFNTLTAAIGTGASDGKTPPAMLNDLVQIDYFRTLDNDEGHGYCTPLAIEL
jgi:hypothetical protein